MLTLVYIAVVVAASHRECYQYEWAEVGPEGDRRVAEVVRPIDWMEQQPGCRVVVRDAFGRTAGWTVADWPTADDVGAELGSVWVDREWWVRWVTLADYDLGYEVFDHRVLRRP